MKFWMVWRYLSEGRKYLSVTFVLTVFGVALGVASLVLAMSIVSGYETTLRNTVINMQGHILVSRVKGIEGDRAQFEDQIRSVTPELQAMAPFVQLEGLLVHNKKLSGVVIEGVDPATIHFVLSLSKLMVAGRADFQSEDDLPATLIGKGIAKKFGLNVGDEFKLVRPIVGGKFGNGFKPKVQKFRVTGIINLGQAEYDERFILTDIKTAQVFGDSGDRISGWRLKLDDYRKANETAFKIEGVLGPQFWCRPWNAINKNLFKAVKYEKAVIFIIVLLMVVAAAFNVASTLYLSVVRRYAQISILKTLGVTERFIRQMFTLQGLIMGAAGAFLGLLLGWGGSRVFIWAEKKWGLFPGEVYKLDFVELELRTLDLGLILVATMIICYLATLSPAFKGAKLPPIEGLRYE